jgi:hypothetical protein
VTAKSAVAASITIKWVVATVLSGVPGVVSSQSRKPVSAVGSASIRPPLRASSEPCAICSSSIPSAPSTSIVTPTV